MFAPKIIVALALLAGAASAVTYTSDAPAQKYMWEAFKAEHGKRYATMEEEQTRFGIFLATLKLIDARNAKETGTAVHGLNKFADLAQDEFAARFLNYVHDYGDVAHRAKAVGLPDLAGSAVQDWTGVYTTPVKDQGICGSCWAFSVTEQAESDYMRAGGNQTILSPQQVTSCTKYWLKSVGGCNGGKPETGYKYAEGGLETEANYPYTSGAAGVTGACQANASQFAVKATSYTNVASSSADEAKMGAYVAGTGPLSIVVDASEWSTYAGGVLTSCGTSLDHAVQVVGVDTSAANGSYWKVRNSWGTGWGESGHIRLAYGKDMCGIASDANFAEVTSV